MTIIGLIEWDDGALSFVGGVIDTTAEPIGEPVISNVGRVLGVTRCVRCGEESSLLDPDGLCGAPCGEGGAR